MNAISLYKIKTPQDMSVNKIYSTEELIVLKSNYQQKQCLLPEGQVFSETLRNNALEIKYNKPVLDLDKVRAFVRANLDRFEPSKIFKPVKDNLLAANDLNAQITKVCLSDTRPILWAPLLDYHAWLYLYGKGGKKLGELRYLFPDQQAFITALCKLEPSIVYVSVPELVATQTQGDLNKIFDAAGKTNTIVNAHIDISRQELEKMCQVGLSKNFLDAYIDGQTTLYATL